MNSEGLKASSKKSLFPPVHVRTVFSSHCWDKSVCVCICECHCLRETQDKNDKWFFKLTLTHYRNSLCFYVSKEQNCVSERMRVLYMCFCLFVCV